MIDEEDYSVTSKAFLRERLLPGTLEAALKIIFLQRAISLLKGYDWTGNIRGIKDL